MTDPNEAARLAELEAKVEAAIEAQQHMEPAPEPAPQDAVPAQPAPAEPPGPVVQDAPPTATETAQAARIRELEAAVAHQQQVNEMSSRIAQLEAQLAALTTPTPEGSGNPAEPTHLRVLACGHSEPVLVPAATQHHCPDCDVLQPVVAYHEIPAPVAA